MNKNKNCLESINKNIKILNKRILKNRQRIKSEALNEIIKIYNENNNDQYDRYDERNCAEQRDRFVSNIIYNMKSKLKDNKLIKEDEVE